MRRHIIWVALLALSLPTVQAQSTGPNSTAEESGFVENLLERAQQGEADAQLILGVMYANGRGVPEDDAEAVRWYTLAAEQGHAAAQSNLGVMYANGEGVPEDDAEAVRWYTLAAQQGHALAQLSLGVMYATGRGVPENSITAYAWINVAAAQGVEMARDARETIKETMTPKSIAEAQELSNRYWQSYGPDSQNR